MCWVQAPRDKLVCILNCCRVINNLLHAAVAAGEARGERPPLSTAHELRMHTAVKGSIPVCGQEDAHVYSAMQKVWSHPDG